MGSLPKASKPEYGKRLLPNLVDDYARTDPDHVFAIVPKSSSFEDGFQDITIRTFARAVSEVAHRIDSVAGKSTKFDTIAYIGPSQSLLLRKSETLSLTPTSGPKVFCHRSWCFESRI